MHHSNALILSAGLGALAGAAQLPLRPTYLLTQAEIRSVPNADDIAEVIRRTRSCWLAFSTARQTGDFPPPNPCSFSLDRGNPGNTRASTCSPRMYLDNERVYGAMNLISPDD